MNKIKDFFYNKNDIIIALIILALAAAVIYWRVGGIMSYPDKLADAQTTTKQEATSTSSEAETTTDASETTSVSETTTTEATASSSE